MRGHGLLCTTLWASCFVQLLTVCTLSETFSNSSSRWMHMLVRRADCLILSTGTLKCK